MLETRHDPFLPRPLRMLRDWARVARTMSALDIRYDVIAVTIAEPRTVRLLAHDKDGRNAEAIIGMAVVRRGVRTEFYTTALHGKYRDGDEYAP